MAENKIKASHKDEMIDADLADFVVVDQWKTEFVSGGIVRLPWTYQRQTYYPEVYAKMVKDNFFSESQFDIELVHKP